MTGSCSARTAPFRHPVIELPFPQLDLPAATLTNLSCPTIVRGTVSNPVSFVSRTLCAEQSHSLLVTPRAVVVLAACTCTGTTIVLLCQHQWSGLWNSKAAQSTFWLSCSSKHLSGVSLVSQVHWHLTPQHCFVQTCKFVHFSTEHRKLGENSRNLVLPCCNLLKSGL